MILWVNIRFSYNQSAFTLFSPGAFATRITIENQRRLRMKKHLLYSPLSKRILAAVLSISLSACSYSVPSFAAEIPAEEVQADTDTDTGADAADTIPVITAIAPLSDTEAELSFDDKPSLESIKGSLPKELPVFLDDSESPIPLAVTWECGDDYENTEFDVYEFTPVWDTDAYPLAPSFDSFSDMPYVTVSVLQDIATVRLLDADEAISGLSSLAQNKDIYALLYLCDTYEVKQQPGKTAETAVTISTGQSVRITGAGEDSSYHIWYQVSLEIGGNIYNGYIERDYLAYSDEDLLTWEAQSISSRTYRMAAPAAPGNSAGLPADIAQFPASYQSGLLNLKTAHPNWIFVRMNTNLDWKTAVQEENKESRSLISASVNSAWKTSSFDKSWAYPTDGILAYYMDPRNFLTEKHIFQFELLSYNETYHTESAVQGILNGTFMSGAIPGDAKGRSYAQAFCAIAKQLDVSPFHLASRVRQEQGEGTSDLISGTHPVYPAVYNYFNIGASGKGSAQIIENGLKKASEYKWTTRYLSLEGGSNIISKDYIRKGQNTLYLQKFNVSKTSSAGLYQHQYMQNIAAPSSEAVSVQKAYAAAGSIHNPFVFRIPVYEGMPSSACPQPAAVKEITLNSNTISLKIGETAALTVSIDGKTADMSSVSFSSSDPAVASVNANGTVTAISAGSAVISCTVGSLSASCTVSVAKTDPSYTLPVLGAVTYAPEQTLADITLPSGWKWDNPSIVPTVSNAGYPATFTPSDTGKYNTVQKTVALTVNRGTPVYTIPSGLQTIAGDTLASIKLPAGFSWENPSTVLQKEGTVSCMASYNPDEANYQTVTGISIPVTVTKKSTDECTSHSYGEWVVSAPASCISAGTQTRSCRLCGAKENASLPALGHNYSSAITKEATETENGIRTYTCSRCGDTYTETIDKLPASHSHHYTSKITTEPSCTAAGIITYTCSCGDSYTEAIAASGHDYHSRITREATETEAGIRTYTCSKCQNTYTESIAKLPSSHKHSYSSSVIKQASCTEKGIKTYSCSCGDTYSEEIPALGHDMAEGKCRRCGYTAPNTNQSQQNGSSSSGGNNSSASGSSSSSNENHSAGSNPSGNGTSANGSNGSNSHTANGNSTSNGNTTAGNPPANHSSLAGSSKTNTNTGSTTTAASSADNSTKTVTMDMKNTTVLYEETISAIRGQDIDVVLNMGNSISWMINGSNIVADEANGIDMGITVDAGNIPELLIEQARSLSGTGIVMELSLAHTGALDFHPVLIIHTAPENAGHTANLYYYNPENGQLEFVEATQVAEDGEIRFTFSHASDYVIIISETVMSDTGAIAPSDAGDSETGTETTPEEDPNTELPEQPSSSFQPSVLLIIAIILLIVIAIACTVFFLFRSRNKEDEMEEEDFEDDEEDEDDFWEENWKASSEEDSALDDECDDYREPEKRKPMGNNPRQVHDEYEDDEFDGFE